MPMSDSPEVESVRQQLADVQQRIQHLVAVSNARLALQSQAQEEQPEPLAVLW